MKNNLNYPPKETVRPYRYLPFTLRERIMFLTGRRVKAFFICKQEVYDK